jgi:hypothetical protein
LFFPEGRESILDVSPTSKFQYAQELRELLPEESEKQFLMFDDVAKAFHRLMMSYIQRTSALQKFGNALFRVQLQLWFHVQRLPSWLVPLMTSDISVIGASPSPAHMLAQSEFETPSPDNGLLLRTKSTTAEAFSRAPHVDVLLWDDQTEQLVRFMLHRLFHPDTSADVRPGHRVCIFGMSSAFLNGAEGYYERRSPLQPDRVEVRLAFPAAVVRKVMADKDTTVVMIPENRIMRYPDVSDVVSFRRLRHIAAAGCAEAGAWLHTFEPFLNVLGSSLQRGADPDISMADVVERFRMSSCNLCLGSSFLDPVHAYLLRKIRHARQKLQPVTPPTDTKVIKIVKGCEYYSLINDSHGSKYRLFRLLNYCAHGTAYMAKVQFVNADGSLSDSISAISFPNFGCFIPKEEFADYVADVTKASFDSALADTRYDFSNEAYHKDSHEILSCIAASFPEFRVHGKMPSRALEKQYTLHHASKGKCLEFTEFDLGMSFKSFFSEDFMPSCDAEKRARLLKSAALDELNRCFFIHLGLALDVHPFALQVAPHFVVSLKFIDCLKFLSSTCSYRAASNH